MLNQGQVQAIRRGVNTALGLLVDHEIGNEFVWNYIESVDSGWSHASVTTYKAIKDWFYFHGFHDFNLTKRRYEILIGILECLQATLGVELLNEGGDKPLPPQLEDKS